MYQFLLHRRELLASSLATAAAALMTSCRNQAAPANLTPVRLGLIPYGDHTEAIIGVTKGWFQEAGIDLHLGQINPEQVVPLLTNGSYDIVSTSPGILLTAYDAAPNTGMFAFGSLFQGYGLMAKPGTGVKTVAQLRATGLSDRDATDAAIRQIKGHVFAYPPEGGIKPFITLLLQRGSLRPSDFRALIVDDPVAVSAMRRGDANFQVGGAPSRIALEKDGFIAVVSAGDLARTAEPGRQSPELAAVFPDGWATTKAYYDRNQATILRLASVLFRIVKYMNTSRDDALAIHMPYLSKVTGQSFTALDGRIIYDSLDPFVPFEQQAAWFQDPRSPYYMQNWFASIIGQLSASGTFKTSHPTSEGFVWAGDVYRKMLSLKAAVEARLGAGSGLPKDLVSRARSYASAYNYYDALRIIENAK